MNCQLNFHVLLPNISQHVIHARFSPSSPAMAEKICWWSSRVWAQWLRWSSHVFLARPAPPPNSKTLRHCGSYFLENGVASSRGDRHERYRVDIDIDDYSNTTKNKIYHANQEIQQQIAAHNNQFLQKQKNMLVSAGNATTRRRQKWNPDHLKARR